MSSDGKLYPFDYDEPTPDFYSQAILKKMTECVATDLNKYGLCALDNFMKRLCCPSLPKEIKSEIQNLYTDGKFKAGQTIGSAGEKLVRTDLITWITGEEAGVEKVSLLMKAVDSLVHSALNHEKAGQLDKYHMSVRTKVMAACYPGGSSRYLRHVDNPHGDGRIVTSIYYLNENWSEQDGGELVLYTSAPRPNTRVVIKPIFDRLVFFWSDRRNPHEVKPSFSPRLALTMWYIDEGQRKEYIRNMRAKLLAVAKLEKENLGSKAEQRAVDFTDSTPGPLGKDVSASDMSKSKYEVVG